jgi:1-acyl-sn-glycerol-3-phosphate acyltransferase
MIRSTLAYVFVSLFVLVVSPIAFLWAWISGDAPFIYRAGRFCLYVAGWICGVRVRTRGKEILSSGQTFLFLSNHQGNLDAPVIICTVADRHLRALFKQEMMRIPVLPLAMKKVGFVPIDRTDPTSAHASLDHAAKMLRDGNSFFAFPEGTRSRNGSLGPFKKGVFHMAIKAGVPIVPVTIKNTNLLQPPGSYRIRPGIVELTFHNPIPASGLQVEDRDRLIEAVRTAIAAGL